MRIYYVENSHIGWHTQRPDGIRIGGCVLYGRSQIALYYYERNVHRKRYTRADAEAVVEWLNEREQQNGGPFGLMVPGSQANLLSHTDNDIPGPGISASWLELAECRDTAE